MRSSSAVVLYTAANDRGGGWSIRKAAWSPDSRTLAVVLQDSGWDHVYLIPASGGAPKPLTEGAFEDADPAFSPSGHELAILSSRKNLEASQIWIVPLDKIGAPPADPFSRARNRVLSRMVARWRQNFLSSHLTA